MQKNILNIIKDSNYSFSIFGQKLIDELESKIAIKDGRDNSGEYVFVKNGNNQPKLDKNGHLIINHDLHNHGGELTDGVAEKFIEWAKSEKLSFWK